MISELFVFLFEKFQKLDDFEFKLAPLSSIYSCFGLILGYLMFVHLFPRLKFQVKTLFFLHNAILCTVSLFLFACFVEQVYPMFNNKGLFYSICNKHSQTPVLNALYYVTYLTKFYEFIDTVFLIVKGKNVEFLHYYHHSMTALLCFSQLWGGASVQWVPISLNLFVHVVMYLYYALTSLGLRFWWKKYITTLQIIQFVIDLVVCYYCTFIGLVFFVFNDSRLQLLRPLFSVFYQKVDCEGNLLGAFFGCFILTSYLVLFIQFFGKSYRKSKTN